MIFLFWEHILFTERIALYNYTSCACAHNANLDSQKQYFGKKLNPIVQKIKELFPRIYYFIQLKQKNMERLIRLIHGDCLVEMQNIPDKSIDAIICDLPYGVLNKNNPHAKWDSVIPFVPLWKQYERVIKDNGAIILFGQGMFSAELMISNKKLWRYNLIWDKVAKTGFLNANKMPLRQHEDILVFYKKLCTYNPQMQKCEPHKRNHGKGKNETPSNSCYGKFVSTPTIISDEKFPTSIISISKPHKNSDYFHPTQKSVECLEYLIKTYTNEGETVLDNTMGSGTTGVACVNTNRNFIGIELDDHYFEVASERINKTMQYV